MKTILSILLTISLFSCGSDGNTPVAVSKSYFRAVNNNDLKEARRYVGEDYYRIIDRIEKAVQENPALKDKQELIDEYYELMMEEDGVAIVAMGAKIKGSNVRVDYDVWLRKKDGKWLISEVVPKD